MLEVHDLLEANFFYTTIGWGYWDYASAPLQHKKRLRFLHQQFAKEKDLKGEMRDWFKSK